MPGPSKFTADRRERILEALRYGSSYRTAAAYAGVDPSQLTRWLQRGRAAKEGAYSDFAAAVEKAEAEPKIRALRIVHDAMADKPDLAWKYVERRERGFAPPQPNMHQAPPQVNIRLSLPGHEGAVPVHNEVIEGEVVDEPERLGLPPSG